VRNLHRKAKYCHSRADLVGLVVQHHQIPVGHVEPGQMLTRILGIKYILVHYKRCSLGVGGITSGKNIILML